MSQKADLIKQARSLILRHLEIIYPSSLNFRSLHQTLCHVDAMYDEQLLTKDLFYLSEKGYLLCTSGKLANMTDRLATFRLTAAGLEIAQQLKEDKALEI